MIAGARVRVLDDVVLAEPFALRSRGGAQPMFFGKPSTGSHEHLHDDSLADVVRHFGRELAASATLVIWHSRTNDPVTLFAAGDCVAGSALENDMIEESLRTLRSSQGRSHSAWHTTAGMPAAMLTTAVATASGTFTLTAAFRNGDSATPGQPRDAAARLLPFVESYFRLWELRSEVLSRLRGVTAALDHSDVATLFVDRGGRVLFADLAANALMGVNDGLARSGGMLRGTRLSDTMRLQAAVEHVLGAGSSSDGDANVTPVVALKREHGRPLMAAIMASMTGAAGEEDSLATIYIFDPEADCPTRFEPACKLYGLSPVETRLTCMIAGGASLTEAAAAMRIRGETARSYLKQIFFKTDTHRQAELV